MEKGFLVYNLSPVKWQSIVATYFQNHKYNNLSIYTYQT